MAYTPPTIEEVGVQKWLTDKGYSWVAFVSSFNDYSRGVMSRAGFARKMGVDPRTLDTWIDAARKELAQLGSNAVDQALNNDLLLILQKSPTLWATWNSMPPNERQAVIASWNKLIWDTILAAAEARHDTENKA